MISYKQKHKINYLTPGLAPTVCTGFTTGKVIMIKTSVLTCHRDMIKTLIQAQTQIVS